MMTGVTHRRIYLYVNRPTLQWVVQDEEGKYWVLPHGERPWEHRQEASSLEDLELEPIPGHYKPMLGIPD
jgi:hypothetical protein